MSSDNTQQVPEINDSVFDFDMPDIPMPEDNVVKVIEDKFKSACRFAFLGIGRAGSRIAEAFYKLGYARVCVMNTAKQDLDEIKIPETNKLWFPEASGAGGNRKVGAKYVSDHYEDVVDLMRRSFGPELDRIIICIGAGGGTGSGGVEIATSIASAYIEHMRIAKIGEKTRVGLMIALPSNSERTNMRNAYDAMKFVEKKLDEKALSPVIIIDNESVMSQHAGATIGNVWEKVNQSAVTLLHTFNAISVAPTQHIALDPADLETILETGVLTYGATALPDSTPGGLSQAIQHAIKHNMLCSGFNMETAKFGGCILAGEADVINGLSSKDIDQHFFEKVERITGGAHIHRGIYATKKKLAAYTMFGGMDLPKDRLNEVAKLAGFSGWEG